MAAFADRLWRLKIEAGDPSFAEMASQLGAAASKSSLAAAAQGRTLPSWGTAWEFVRVLAVERLGRDPEETEREWRELWRRTKLLSELEDVPESEAAAEPEGAPEPDAAPPRHVVRVRPRRLPSKKAGLVVSALSAAVVAGAVSLVLLLEEEPSGTPLVTPPVSQVQQVDDSVFEGDITYKDGSRVEKGETFEKVWRLRNVGSVEWEGRFLMRMNDAPCRTPDRVEIPRTPPGRSVDIKVLVRAPQEPGNCRIYWKMVDLQGRSLFPGKRPIFLDVRVR